MRRLPSLYAKKTEDGGNAADATRAKPLRGQLRVLTFLELISYVYRVFPCTGSGAARECRDREQYRYV